ncbi:MAG: histidine kinase [Taibaiella sp.]|nr:histidine kinase [Taibaiella sp.]
MRSVKKINWFFLLLLLFFAATAQAQHPCYLKLNRQDGLPSDAVYNVFQDSKGFMWMATGEGLCRYDGFEFVSYKSTEQTSLPGSCIREDKYGRIWYENFDGYLYYTDSGKLKSINQNTPYYYLPFGISTHYLYITTNKGADIYDIATLKHVKSLDIPVTTWINTVSSSNAYYMLSENILYKISDDLSLTSCKIPTSEKGVLHNMYAAPDGVYITSGNSAEKGFYCYDKNLKLVKKISIQGQMTIQHVSAIDSSIFINSPTGSFTYAIEDASGERKAAYFNGKSVSGVIKDRQNNIWFSTTNEGLFIVPDMKNILFPTETFTINKIVVARDGYFAATQKGKLLHVNQNFENSMVVSSDPGNSSIYYLYADSQYAIYSSLGFTLTSVAGKKYEHKKIIALKEVVRLDNKYYAFASSVFCGFMKNHSSSNSEKSVWDSLNNSEKNTRYPDITPLINLVRGKSVTYDAQNRQIFFATNKGVYCVSPHAVSTITPNGQSVFANSLQAVNGVLYALTSMGLVLKIPYTPSGAVASCKNLPLKDISIMKRFGNELYLFGEGNLYKLNTINDSIERIEISIDINGINDILKDKEKLYVVTNEGIISLNNQGYKTKRKPALFYINSVTANGKPISADGNNELNYFENNITISFSVLDFGTVVQAGVYYKLNDNEWKEITKGSRLLQFPALANGSYTLSFKLGEYGSIVKKIQFSIQPAFWKQWWFYLICLLVVFTLILVYYKRKINVRINKLEAQKKSMQLEQELGKSMLTSIRAQMNPHFFYNALNTIQAYIFMNDKTRASSYLAKFSRLTRIILEMSEAETVSLNEEAETMKLYLDLEKMRFESGFEYDMQFHGIDNKEMIEIPSMIIQPYIENAIKHGLLHKNGDKLLHIIFERNSNILQVTIDDNGIGRKRSEELNKIRTEKYRSFATKASEKRMELLNKGRSEKIKIEITDKTHPNGSAAGTRVVIKIPI